MRDDSDLVAIKPSVISCCCEVKGTTALYCGMCWPPAPSVVVELPPFPLDAWKEDAGRL